MSKAETALALKKVVGRPKSASSHAAIMAAARSILDEVGPTRLTIDGVAKRAGVGKPTIYRTWANAQELAMAALVTPDDIGVSPVSAGLEALLENIITRLNTKRGRQMALMLASAEPDGELFKAFANRVILKGREDGLAILQRQIAAGTIRADTDLPAVLDMLFGAVMLRLLLRHEPLDGDFARRILASAMEGVAVH